LAVLQAKLKEYQEVMEKTEAYKRSLIQLEATKTAHERELSTLQKALIRANSTLKEFQKPLTLNCNVCNAPLTEAKQLALTEEQSVKVSSQEDIICNLLVSITSEEDAIRQVTGGVNMVKELIASNNSQLVDRAKVIEAINDTQRALNKLPQTSAIDRFIAEQQANYTKAIESSFIEEDLTAEKAHWELQAASYEQEMAQLEDQQKRFEFWSVKGFANKGIKAHLTFQVLSQLNNKLVEYSQYIGWGLKMVMLDDAARTLAVEIYRNNEKVNFKTLSGGEARRVETAITLALNDALSASTTRLNLLALDEPFHHLDDEGITMVMELLRAREGSILITSNQSLDSLSVQTLRLEKGKNGTFIA